MVNGGRESVILEMVRGLVNEYEQRIHKLTTDLDAALREVTGQPPAGLMQLPDSDRARPNCRCFVVPWGEEPAWPFADVPVESPGAELVDGDCPGCSCCPETLCGRGGQCEALAEDGSRVLVGECPCCDV